MDFLTIALPKGTLFKPSLKLLKEVGLDVTELEGDSRKLIFVDNQNKFKYIICRPTDIPTFVEYGAADIGLVGKDTIVEQKKDVYELLDLKYGYCRFVVAVPAAYQGKKLEEFGQARVATKFPRVAENYFRSRGLQVEIIKLHGNIELAPIVGLSDLIVDIVSSGRTLRENNLVEMEQIFSSTTRLVANPVSHRMKNNRINPIMDKMREIVEKGGIE